MAEPLRLLDTSVIIRYLSNDIPHLAQRARGTPALRPSGSVGFGDALIAATGRSAGVSEAYSFDARFSRVGLRVVPMPESSVRSRSS